MTHQKHNQQGVRRVKVFQAVVLTAILGVGSVKVFLREAGPARLMAQAPTATQPAPTEAEAKPAAGATTQPAPGPVPAPEVSRGEGKYQSVSFNELAGVKLKLKYTLSETGERLIKPGSVIPQIPGNVKELSGKKVAVRGYLLPIEFDEGKSTRFILMRFTPDCMYCSSPSLVDWVDATSKEGMTMPQNTHTPVEVTGTLSVAEREEDGLITSIYQMKVDGVTVVKPEAMREGQPGGVAPVAPGHGGPGGHGNVGG